MNGTRLFILVVIVTAAAFAQPKRRQPQRGTGSAVVEGRVLSSFGVPLEDAEVTAQPTVPRSGQPPRSKDGRPLQSFTSVRTDAAGKFIFEGLVAGTWTFVGRKTGYSNGWNAGGAVELTEEQHLSGLSIKLAPAGRITGKVVSETGEPIPAIEVSLHRWVMFQGRKGFALAASSSSPDANGRFAFPDLNPGCYYVSAEPPSARAVPKDESAYALTYYPASPGLAGAIPVCVRDGAGTSGIDIRMRRTPVFRVKGQIVDASGQPVPNIAVGIFPKKETFDPGPPPPLPGMRDGSFEFRNLAPGEYTIRAGTAFVNPESSLLGIARVTIRDRDVDDLAIPVGPALTVEGRVRMKSEKDARFEQSNLQVTLTTVEYAGAVPQRSARVAADGTFRISGLAASLYRVTVRGLAPGSYVSSMRAGEVNAVEAPVNITSSGTNLDIVLSDAAAAVSGRLVDQNGKPLPNLTVTLWKRQPPPGRPWEDTRVAATNEQGYFRIGDLAPGDYAIAAWEDSANGLVQLSDFRAPFAGRATRVELQERANVAADPVVIPKKDVDARRLAF